MSDYGGLTVYCIFNENVSVLVPYLNQILELNFSITTRQILKVNMYSDRINLALSEYNFTFNFFRVVIEKLYSKIMLRYGTGTSSLAVLYLSVIKKKQRHLINLALSRRRMNDFVCNTRITRQLDTLLFSI